MHRMEYYSALRRKETLSHNVAQMNLTGVSNLLVSLGYTRRRLALDHTLNTQILTKTGEQKQVLSEFTVVWQVAVTDILGCMRPMGCGLDSPEGAKQEKPVKKDKCCLIPLIHQSSPFIERESRTVADKGWGEKRMGSCRLIGIEFQLHFFQMKREDGRGCRRDGRKR